MLKFKFTRGGIEVNGKKLVVDDLTRYPIGSLYFSDKDTSPAAIYGGSWTKIEGRVLIGAGSIEPDGAIPQDDSETKITYEVGKNPSAGLPNIKGGNINAYGYGQSDNRFFYSGALYKDIFAMSAGGNGTVGNAFGIYIDASRYNPIYGNSTTVQPNGYVINIWQRTA